MTELIAIGIILAVGFLFRAFRAEREHEWQQSIIEREMSTAPPEPVHPDLLTEIVDRGGYDIADERPVLTEDDMEAVRKACRRVSG